MLLTFCTVAAVPFESIKLDLFFLQDMYIILYMQSVSSEKRVHELH